ncbi:hypothetical protein B9T62_19260 [Paenibacillus donghaensis]|uniref:Uncharacterized protein n=2 Tax=Paenibacillus donghaensis TaxID=414771 RepID=A0A2Z2KB45_9BACL|nr:hypothetical protein B9T62_19260 [Paenibacillus donghaensis]
MYVTHDGINNNKSNIDLSVLQSEITESSILDIPVLAHILTEDEDFGEHEMEYDEIEKKITYIEKPIGLVSSKNHNYHYEEVDGRTYAVVDGYIWNVYSQDAIDIINRDENIKLSVELVIDESIYDKKTKILDIKKFRYTGITLLGKKYGTGMVNAHAELERFSETDEFSDKIEELNTFLMRFSQNSEQEPGDEKSNLESYTLSKEEDKVVLKKKQEIAALFKLTVNQLYSELSRAMSKHTYIDKNWYGESVERTCFWLNDYDESFVYYVDVKDNYMDKKAPYSLDGDNVNVDLDNCSRIKYSPIDWEDGMSDEDSETSATREMMSSLETEALSKLEEIKVEKETMTTEFTEKITEKDESIIELGKTIAEMELKFTTSEQLLVEKDEAISSLTSEIAKYKEEEDIEKVDSLFVEYSALITEDEKRELTEKRATFSTFNDFEKEVKLFLYDRIVKKAKEHKMNFISMGLPIDNEAPDDKKTQSLWERLGNN